jgi:hypothetical protein
MSEVTIDRCDFCGQRYDSMRGICANLDKLRHGQFVATFEMCGDCYKVLSDAIKKIKANELGQIRLLEATA